MAKCYVSIYYDFMELTEGLTDAERGRLLAAMIEYSRDGAVTGVSLEGSVALLFPVFRRQIDRDSDAYRTRVLQNAINGSKGGRPRKHENDEINPTVIPETEKTQYKEKEKEEEEDKEQEKERGVKGADAPRAPALDEVLDFCRENGLAVNGEAFWNHYQAVGWRAGRHAIRDWQAKLREWAAKEANPAGGTVRAPTPGGAARDAPNPALAYAQRDYGDDEGFFIDLDAYGEASP